MGMVRGYLVISVILLIVKAIEVGTRRPLSMSARLVAGPLRGKLAGNRVAYCVVYAYS